VTGVRVRGPGGEREIPADVVVGADGTRSRVRELAGIEATLRLSDTAFVGFRSPVRSEEAFLIEFTSDGRQLTLLDWPGGSAGGWQIDRPEGGEEAALAPGVEAFKRAYLRLLPGAAAAVEPVTTLHYREVTEVSCEIWWRPGVTLIGEALHAMNPEAGIGSGLGMADAQALAIAIGQNRDDPDRALAEYERWRRPAVAPYLAIGSQGVRVVRGGELRDEERWPPPA
jgi:2-polyprenyl-6-methoxyphenol hydroxylase-like FAD-dependent oxidoreductase